MGGKGSGRKSDLAKLKEETGKTETRGRKQKTVETGNAKKVLSGALIYAVQYLRDCVTKVEKRPSPTRVDVAKFIVNQELGSPKAKHEVTGEGGKPLFDYAELIKQAEKAEREGIVGGDGHKQSNE